LRFDTVGAPASSPPVQQREEAAPIVAPVGRKFDCRLLTTIDSETSAVGDAIEGVLTSPIRDAKGAVWAPEGTRLRGRLLRLTTYTSWPRVHDVGLRWESVLLNGVSVPIRARCVRDAGEVADADLSWLRRLARDHAVGPLSGEYVFQMKTKSVHLENWEAPWVTIELERGKKAK
jgi:hypothetical protein